MNFLILSAVAIIGLVSVGNIAYLMALLIAASLAGKHRPGRRTRVPDRSVLSPSESAPPRGDGHHFTFLVPAHNEEMMLPAMLDSISEQEYPKERYRVVIVADNCTDSTARVALEYGATCLERTNLQERGKGYALDWAMSQLLEGPDVSDAFVIIDADTWVSPGFLTQMSLDLTDRIDTSGRCALQGRYGVLNEDESWRTALMTAAFELFNHVKPLGQDHLGLSVGLKGNGMVFTRALLQQAKWSGESITEDIDFGIDLIRKHNMRVGYVPGAYVRAQMPVSAAQAISQRERWENGRFKLMREKSLPLLWEGVRLGNLRLVDSAIDLMLAPLAELTGLMCVWTLLVVVFGSLHMLWMHHLWQVVVASVWGLLIAYVVGGLRLSGASRETYLALLRTPVYIAWKLILRASGPLRRIKRSRQLQGSPEWVRTERAAPQASKTKAEARSK